MAAAKGCARCGCVRHDKPSWLLRQGWVCVVVNGCDIWTCSSCVDQRGNQ